MPIFDFSYSVICFFACGLSATFIIALFCLGLFLHASVFLLNSFLMLDGTIISCDEVVQRFVFINTAPCPETTILICADIETLLSMNATGSKQLYIFRIGKRKLISGSLLPINIFILLLEDK
jgi:hypothetical protein